MEKHDWIGLAIANHAILYRTTQCKRGWRACTKRMRNSFYPRGDIHSPPPPSPESVELRPQKLTHTQTFKQYSCHYTPSFPPATLKSPTYRLLICSTAILYTGLLFCIYINSITLLHFTPLLLWRYSFYQPLQLYVYDNKADSILFFSIHDFKKITICLYLKTITVIIF